jgi:hypothetical protein
MTTGHIESTTWGEIEVGHIVRDKNDHLHTVANDDGTFVTLTPAHGRDPVVSIRRPAADRPVDIYVPSEAEAVNLLDKELGARYLRFAEETAHSVARALNWRVDPIPRKLIALRDHIDWLHGANVDDVLRKGTGTKINPADTKRKKASIEELCQAHDEMHADPATWPMPFAHHHARIEETS